MASKGDSRGISSKEKLIYLEKCIKCGKPATSKCSGCSLAFYCGPQHQKADWIRHKPDCRPYTVQTAENIGGCLVASKYIHADTIIISEYPIAIFEDLSWEGTSSVGSNLQRLLVIADAYLYNCPGCDSGKIVPGKEITSLNRCSKCGMPLCSVMCQGSRSHCERDCKMLQDIGTKENRSPSEISKILQDLKLVRIIQGEKRKGTPISFASRKWGPLLKHTLSAQNKGTPALAPEKCSVPKQLLSALNLPHNFPLSIAATDKSRLDMVALLHWMLKQYSVKLPNQTNNSRNKRALYEKHPFLSHSCAPNTECWIDDNLFYYKLICRVIRPIVPGERITANLSNDHTLLCMPTLERRQKLVKQLSLNCDCERCIDSTEKDTCLSGIRCNVCKDALTSGYYFPTNPLDKRTSWTCSGRNCKATKSFEQVLVLTLKAEKELQSISAGCSSGQVETAISKLQDFIVKHQRKILHPGHYLIVMARSRINKAVSLFLGSGEKLFLCVVTDQPRAYDYCVYKMEYLNAYLSFLMKLYDDRNEKTIGKLRYELAFAEAALLFQDFHQERLAATSFFKRLHNVLETLTKCHEALMPYSDCGMMIEDVKNFGKVMRRLFGTDFLASYRLKYLETSDLTLRHAVNEAITKWSEACELISLGKVYMNPTSFPKDEENLVTKEDLQNILIDIPDFDQI